MADLLITRHLFIKRLLYLTLVCFYRWPYAATVHAGRAMKTSVSKR